MYCCLQSKPVQLVLCVSVCVNEMRKDCLLTVQKPLAGEARQLPSQSQRQSQSQSFAAAAAALLRRCCSAVRVCVSCSVGQCARKSPAPAATLAHNRQMAMSAHNSWAAAGRERERESTARRRERKREWEGESWESARRCVRRARCGQLKWKYSLLINSPLRRPTPTPRANRKVANFTDNTLSSMLAMPCLSSCARQGQGETRVSHAPAWKRPLFPSTRTQTGSDRW